MRRSQVYIVRTEDTFIVGDDDRSLTVCATQTDHDQVKPVCMHMIGINNGFLTAKMEAACRPDDIGDRFDEMFSQVFGSRPNVEILREFAETWFLDRQTNQNQGVSV